MADQHLSKRDKHLCGGENCNNRIEDLTTAIKNNDAYYFCSEKCKASYVIRF